jgi:uncharacterized protein
MTGPAPDSRFVGFDLARGCAILGMVVVHFVLVMTQDSPSSAWGKMLLDAVDGRPAVTFVLLAGIGVSLMARRSDAKQVDARDLDGRLWRRGIFLLAFGYLNLVIWPGDILRVYGVSLCLAPWFLRRKSRGLLMIAAVFVAIFCGLMLVVDYEQNWEWSTMTYHRLWTIEGALRNLFYDGFRSVFPWTGLLLFGIWLGRWDWRDPAAARKAMKWGVALMIVSWSISELILGWFAEHPQPELKREDAVALFGMSSMPPLPLFLMNAIGFAMLTIGACMRIASRCGDAWPVKLVAAVGRLAFTWYVGHIVIGLGGVMALGWTQASYGTALAAGVAFFGVAAGVSLVILRRFRTGPLEWLLRRVG